jgi:hypothetical protein
MRFCMTVKAKPTYEELESRVRELEKIESEHEYAKKKLQVYEKALLGYQALDENGHFIVINQTRKTFPGLRLLVKFWLMQNRSKW